MARTVPHPYNLCSWIEIVLKCSKDSIFLYPLTKIKDTFLKVFFFFFTLKNNLYKMIEKETLSLMFAKNVILTTKL